MYFRFLEEEMYIYHEFLVKANRFEEAWAKVERFLDLYELVSYDEVVVIQQRCCPGWGADFMERIEAAESENRRAVGLLIGELREMGCSDLSGIAALPQGVESKILHTLAHILDGFFGPDSAFFNLLEDSHWVSRGLRGELRAHPEDYWLIAVEGHYSVEYQGFEDRSPLAVSFRQG